MDDFTQKKIATRRKQIGMERREIGKDWEGILNMVTDQN